MAVIAIESQGDIVTFQVGGEQGPATETDIELVFARDEFTRRFHEIEELIATCCNSIRNALEQVPSPEEVKLEFGIEVGGKAGIPFVTEGSAKANFKVTVTWKTFAKS